MAALRISDEQARVLGIEAHIPKRPARAANLDEWGRNKLEAKFGRFLDDLKARGDIKDHRFGSVKFRLAKRTWYEPDYCVIRPDNSIVIYECKGGHFRDDARVKIKVAAEMYPHFRWAVVRWIGGGWDFETIEGRGTS